jgi:hypothetical protein
MSDSIPNYYPFFDPWRDGKPLRWYQKIAIAVGIGVAYGALQFINLDEKAVFWEQRCWMLSVIISFSLLALYVATHVFRENLDLLIRFEGSSGVTAGIIQQLLGVRVFVLAGLVFATLTTGVAHLFGIPADLHLASLPLVAVYLGYFLTGFTCGLGLWAILAVIILYLRFAPNLQHTLNPGSPDGYGGIKSLGDSLWFFAMLIAAVGLLVASYMFSVDWTNLHNDLARSLFLIWLAMPFVMAVSVILIPGLAVRRQVNEFKAHRHEQLKRERASVYSSYKEFEPAPDDDIIATKRQLQDRLNELQTQMQKLKRMRNSPIDTKTKD